jgi:hypothetical protein
MRLYSFFSFLGSRYGFKSIAYRFTSCLSSILLFHICYLPYNSIIPGLQLCLLQKCKIKAVQENRFTALDHVIIDLDICSCFKCQSCLLQAIFVFHPRLLIASSILQSCTLFNDSTGNFALGAEVELALYLLKTLPSSHVTSRLPVIAYSWAVGG